MHKFNIKSQNLSKLRHTHTHRPYVVTFTVEENANKYKDTVVKHNCIKLTIVHTVLL